MLDQEEFREAFKSEVGDEVYKLIRPEEVDRWINRGQARLGVYQQKTAPVSWQAGDDHIDLPADFHHLERFKIADGYLPSGQIWGSQYVFDSAAYLSEGGSGTVLYYCEYPAITSSQVSLLPQVGDDGCLSYALYRFFKRLASSRSDYRRYATVSNSNGVDISELDALSERHLADYQDAKAILTEGVPSAEPFYE